MGDRRRYYLYRQRMGIKAESPDLVLAEPAFPKGILKTDPYFGNQEVYHQQVEATAAYTRSGRGRTPLGDQSHLSRNAPRPDCATRRSPKVLFPGHNAPPPASPAHPWEGAAILGGSFAFLLAGLLLRKGRRLDLPRHE